MNSVRVSCLLPFLHSYVFMLAFPTVPFLVIGRRWHSTIRRKELAVFSSSLRDDEQSSDWREFARFLRRVSVVLLLRVRITDSFGDIFFHWCCFYRNTIYDPTHRHANGFPFYGSSSFFTSWPCAISNCLYPTPCLRPTTERGEKNDRSKGRWTAGTYATFKTFPVLFYWYVNLWRSPAIRSTWRKVSRSIRQSRKRGCDTIWRKFLKSTR